MATTVDTLLVRIEADLSGLRRDLQKTQQATKRSSQQVEKNLDGIKRSANSVTGAFKAIAISAAGFLGAGALVRSIRTFEDLQATLKAVTGSAELAQASFQLITKFTATTTFQLDEVTGAFITLVNAGIAPTEDALKDIGNLAAARGKDIRSVAQAIFNATTGEMEMLKQLGIIARVEGESLNVTYKGVTETIDRSGSAIVNYIRTLSQAEFPNAIEERANTLSGAISNLEDSISLFFLEVGNAGLKDALTDFTKFLISGANDGRSAAQVIGQTLATAVRLVQTALEFAVRHSKELFVALAAITSVKLTMGLVALGQSFVALAVSIRTAKNAAGALNTMLRKSPLGLLSAALAVVAYQSGLLDSALAFVDRKLEEFFGTVEEGTVDVENLEAAIANLGVTAPTESGLDKMGKSLGNLKDQALAAKLEMSGFSQTQIAALKAAGAFEAGLVQPQGSNLATVATTGLNEPKGGQMSAEQLRVLMEAADALDKQTKALEERNDSLSNAKSLIDSLQTPEEQLLQLKKDLKLANDELVITDQEYADRLKEIAHRTKMLNPLFQEQLSAIQSMSSGISDSFADMVQSGKFSFDSLRNIFSDFTKRMISKAFELMVVNRIMNSIFNLSGTSGELQTAPLPFSQSAGGGAISGPRIVGERGPELFIPSSTGVIKNNMDTRNLLGGGGAVVNQVINVDAGVSQTVRAEMMTMLPMFREQAVEAIIDSRRRGGQVATAFGV